MALSNIRNMSSSIHEVSSYQPLVFIVFMPHVHELRLHSISSSVFRMATLLSKFRIDFSDITVLGDINTKPKKEQ